MVSDMKYIEKVILENFQSHKYTVMEFDNQLNVIVGPSDSGKTAILRGIRWVLYNEPSGDYFIREGESECSVTIVFNNKIKVKRYRNKSKNTYILYDSENNETKFEGFGTSVPQEIIDQIGIKKILIDRDLPTAINISDQLEGAFLLSERGSTRANSIGMLVGVNIIDDALRETLKDIRNLSNNKKNIDDNISKLKEELIEYDYLEELNTKINSLQLIRDTIFLKNDILSRYKALHEKSISVIEENKNLNFHIDNLMGVDLLEKKLKVISEKIKKLEYFDKQNSSIKKLLDNKYQDTNVINSLKNINTAEGIIVETTKKYNLNIKLNELKSKLEFYSKETKDLGIFTEKLISLNIVDKNLSVIDNIILDLKKLTILSDKLISFRNSISIGYKYIERLKDINTISNIEDILQEKIVSIDKLKSLYKLYTLNKEERVLSINLIEEHTKKLEIELISYRDILLKQGSCPLCFNNIDDDKIAHILSHYI